MATGGGEALPAQESRRVNTPQESNANASNVHSSQSSQKECTEGSSTVRGKTDPAWEHFAYKKDGRTNVYTCLHCEATYRGGGINRMKQHLTGILGQIAKCKKVPHDVRHRMLESLKEIQEKKQNEDLNEAYDDQLVDPGVQANPTGPNEMQSAAQNKGKRKANVEIGNYFAPRTTPGSQPSFRSVLSSKEAIHKAKMAIARWLYDACIPFNVVQSQYFQPAVDAIAAIGPGFKGPSYHEVRVNLLGDSKRECQLLVQNQRSN